MLSDIKWGRPHKEIFIYPCTFLFFIFLLNLYCNNYLLYHPGKANYLPPERLRLNYEEFYLGGVDQNSIHAWLFPVSSGKATATIVQFHGNAENMSSHYISLIWLAKYNFELFTFDYRGYGRSDGKVDTAKIIADSKLVLKFLQSRNQKKETPIILWGQSLGGILAARALGEMKKRSFIRGIVIEASFASYRSIGQSAGGRVCFPLGYLAYLILSDSYSIQEMLPTFSPIRTIVIHGNADPVVPYEKGREIFALAKEPKDFLEIDKGGHLNWHHLKNYAPQRKQLLKILQDTLKEY